MYRVVSVVVLVVLLLGSLSAIAAFTVEDLGPRVEALETQVAELRDLHGLETTATPEPEPTVTAVPPTATQVPPTATSEPEPTATPTNEPEACSVPSGASTWHAATNHEHGDAPPAWADDWSCEQFGHPVIYGGDEATPNENHHKHEAYKGYSLTKNGVDVYLRVHFASNPMDRQARFHSYELYARDGSDAVSFWQGWMDFGDPATERYVTCTMTHEDNHPLHGLQHGWVSAPDAAAWNAGCRHERWYLRAEDWQWNVVIDILNPTTLYSTDEVLSDPVSEWNTTPNHGKGTSRRIVLYWYGDDSTSRPTYNNPSPRGWFCATGDGVITQPSVSGPGECGSDLPQYIAPTMTSVDSVTSWVTRTYSSSGVVLPN